MRFVILHYHVFKNAGSTIEDILEHSFGERFATLETPANQGVIRNADLIQFLDARKDVRAFSSHQIRYPLPATPGYLFFDICFLRDPLDRLRSFYDYFRQRPNPADSLSEIANRTTLGEFVAEAIRDHSLFVRNNQVNLIACGGDSDEPGERDLEFAIRRMRDASFLGLVDCFEQSAIAGAYGLRRAFPELDCARPAVNVSRGMSGTVEERVAEMRQSCGPDVFEELLRITALDRRLVEAARAEVLRRFEQVRPRKVRTVVGREEQPDGESRGIGSLVGLLPYWRQLAGSARKTLFDPEYFGGSLFDFLKDGVWQGRQPHPLFDPAFYLRTYPDVEAAGLNPFCHYLKHGWKERRQPHPLFDTDFYLNHNPDVRGAGVDPLLHYVLNGAAEDRKPHPLFEPKYYRAACGKTLAVDANPLVHFLEAGIAAASPHPLFDCEAYLDSHPEAVALGVNPLVHYLSSSRKENTSGIVICDVLADPQSPEPQQLPFLQALSREQTDAQV